MGEYYGVLVFGRLVPFYGDNNSVEFLQNSIFKLEIIRDKEGYSSKGRGELRRDKVALDEERRDIKNRDWTRRGCAGLWVRQPWDSQTSVRFDSTIQLESSTDFDRTTTTTQMVAGLGLKCAKTLLNWIFNGGSGDAG